MIDQPTNPNHLSRHRAISEVRQMRLQILVLTVVIMAGVAACIYAFGRSGKIPAVDDGEIKGWAWDGEQTRGAIKEGRGVWKPFYEKEKKQR